MSAELVRLAQKLVDLDREAEETRNAMRRLLANGADPTPNPTRRRGPRSGGGGMRDHLLAKAAAAEEAIVALLREGPKRLAEIMAALNSAGSTTGQRLARLSEKGFIQRGDDGLWSAL